MLHFTGFDVFLYMYKYSAAHGKVQNKMYLCVDIKIICSIIFVINSVLLYCLHFGMICSAFESLCQKHSHIKWAECILHACAIHVWLWTSLWSVLYCIYLSGSIYLVRILIILQCYTRKSSQVAFNINLDCWCVNINHHRVIVAFTNDVTVLCS